MPPMTGVRKPVMVEAVKTMSKVMMEVSKRCPELGTHGFPCNKTSSLIQLVRRQFPQGLINVNWSIKYSILQLTLRNSLVLFQNLAESVKLKGSMKTYKTF